MGLSWWYELWMWAWSAFRMISKAIRLDELSGNVCMLRERRTKSWPLGAFQRPKGCEERKNQENKGGAAGEMGGIPRKLSELDAKWGAEEWQIMSYAADGRVKSCPWFESWRQLLTLTSTVSVEGSGWTTGVSFRGNGRRTRDNEYRQLSSSFAAKSKKEMRWKMVREVGFRECFL